MTNRVCEWGTCDGEATESVPYPDGSVLHCCAECAVVARGEAKHRCTHPDDYER